MVYPDQTQSKRQGLCGEHHHCKVLIDEGISTSFEAASEQGIWCQEQTGCGQQVPAKACTLTEGCVTADKKL